MPEILAITLCLLIVVAVAFQVVSLTLASQWSRSAYQDNYRLCARRIRGLATGNVAIGLLVIVMAIVGIVQGPNQDNGIIVLASGFAGLISLLVCLGLIRMANNTSSIDAERPAVWEERAIDSSRLIRVLAVVAGLLVVVPLIMIAPGLLLLLFFVAILVWPFLIGITRHRRPSQLLWLMSVAVRNNRRLSDELRAHAQACSNAYGKKLYRVAKLLDEGQTLGTALTQVRDVVPTWIVSDILAAEDAGTLATALPELAKQQADRLRADSMRNPLSGTMIYMAACGWSAALVCTFLMIWIIPKFKAIFHGFGTELPKLTMLLIQVTDALTTYPFITGPIVLAGSWLVTELIRADAAGWRNLRTKWLGWLYPKLDGPDVLRHLARAVAGGQPIVVGLASLSRYHFRPTVRAAMQRVREQVEAGADCWEVLQYEGLLGPHDLQLVRSAGQVGNLSWALRELADLRERRFHHRVRLVFEYLQPIPTIVMGLVVFFVVVPLFMPLVKLLNDLS